MVSYSLPVATYMPLPPTNGDWDELKESHVHPLSGEAQDVPPPVYYKEPKKRKLNPMENKEKESEKKARCKYIYFGLI